MIKLLLNAFGQTHGAERYEIAHDQQIHLMEARRGRGKSYNATAITLYALENRIPVVTNTAGLNFQYIAYHLLHRGVHPTLEAVYLWMMDNVRHATTWDDILQAHDCFVILDECSNIFPAKPTDSTVRTPSIMYGWFQQSRKVGVTVWLLTQELPAVVTRVRSLVDWIWFVRKVEHPKKLEPVEFWMYGADAGGAGRVDNLDRSLIERKIRVPFTINTARCYRTHEIIRPLEGEPSFSSLGDLERWHASQGRFYTIDGHAHLRRLLFRERYKPVSHESDELDALLTQMLVVPDESLQSEVRLLN